MVVWNLLPMAVSAEEEEEHYISVGGKWVTNENAGDVLDDGGSVSFNPDTHVLTLNNANITETNNSGENISVSGISLTIELIGDSFISGGESGIYSFDDLTIKGDGTLDIKSSGRCIFGWGNILIKDTTLTATSDYTAIRCNTEYGKITISGSEVTATGKNGYAVFANHAGSGNVSGDVIIENGSKVTAQGTDGAVYAVEDLSISDSTVICKTPEVAMDSDEGSLKISNSIIDIDGARIGIFTYVNGNLSIENGSSVIVRNCKDGIASAGDLTVSASNVLVDNASECAVSAEREITINKVSVLEPENAEITKVENGCFISEPGSSDPALKVLIGKPYSLTVTAGEGGSVSGGDTYNALSEVTVSAKVQPGYRFAGWMKDGKIVSKENPYTFILRKDTNLKAVFQQVGTVTFQNYDETILQSNEVDYGEMPSYDGDTPQRKADGKYTYTFAGWDPEITIVSGDAVYTATFIADKIVIPDSGSSTSAYSIPKTGIDR